MGAGGLIRQHFDQQRNELLRFVWRQAFCQRSENGGQRLILETVANRPPFVGQSKNDWRLSS